VSTPRLELRGATDELLEELVPAVREGHADAVPPPFDDPMSLYESDPALRVHKWLQGIWRGRGSITSDFWRLNLIVVVDGQAAGIQDIIGTDFDTYGTLITFSWLSAEYRRQGLGREMREAALHLSFEGFGAAEAASEAFVDNAGSNRVSEALGYETAPTGQPGAGNLSYCSAGASPEISGSLYDAATSSSTAPRNVFAHSTNRPDRRTWSVPAWSVRRTPSTRSEVLVP
jgi:RimJ/RimL family protein N-acetyltransferase